jgi:hypothetical protein
VAEDQEAAAIRDGLAELPHRAAQHVAPAADQHVGVHAGPVVRFLEGEHARGVGTGQIDEVHAAGRDRLVSRERGTPGDHGVGIPVHERPVIFDQLLAQRHRARTVPTVEEVLHIKPFPGGRAGRGMRRRVPRCH